MDYIRVIALLAHPILASALIFWMWQQYSWRKRSKSLKGDERKSALEQHEKFGEHNLAGWIDMWQHRDTVLKVD